MELIKFIATTIREYLNENISSNNPSEYGGQHSAPSKDGSEPMYNIEDMFPDMYSDKALRYYGGYGLDDAAVIYQIQSVHNKPNKSVVIYRAVPNINKEVDKKIKDLYSILNFKNKYGFFPMKSDIVSNLETKIWDEKPSLTYDEMQKEVYKEISNMVENLSLEKQKPIKINNGDWVTTSKLYAKQHGKSHLNNNYKIVTKTVKASQLYTDGNSIFEWGYNL